IVHIIVIVSVYTLVEYVNKKKKKKDEGTADATNDTETSGETFTIGATQIVEHPSLDNAFEGFKAALEDAGVDVEYDYQNAQNDQNNVKTISDNFVADNVDLIFANSTPSAVGALN